MAKEFNPFDKLRVDGERSRTINITVVQQKPHFGQLERNFEQLAGITDALPKEADLVVFPELSLTGYFLKDLVPEVAMDRSDFLARMNRLKFVKRGAFDLAVGFVERDTHRQYFNAMAYLFYDPNAEKPFSLRHVHRKVFLPTYGMFDEQRFFASGTDFRGFDTRFGRVGILLCEDAWHTSGMLTLALDGAQIFIHASASPARGVQGSSHLGNIEYWDKLNTYAAMTFGVFVAYANRIGTEDQFVFAGSSAVYHPDGSVLARATEIGQDSGDYELLNVVVNLDDIERVRRRTPLLRDELAQLRRVTLPELHRIAYPQDERGTL